MHVDLGAGWHPLVCATDASDEGLGVCSKFMPNANVRQYSLQSERWRFQFEDAVRARDHALFE
eukprot:8041103-Karenia_brevis.AAC.1